MKILLLLLLVTAVAIKAFGDGFPAGTPRAVTPIIAQTSANLDPTLASSIYFASANTTLSINGANFNSAYQYIFSVTVSNTTAGAITISAPTAGYTLIGANSTASQSIAAGKEGFWSFWIRPGFRTNIANCTQQ